MESDTFKHALIQEVAYQSLLKSTRQQYHQRIAEMLEAQFPETCETQPELLAQHYTEAGLREPAVRYWQRAGERAIQRSANVEAISHLTTGPEVLATLPDTVERAQQELRLQTTLGVVLTAARGFGDPDRERTYARALELCQQFGDTPQRFPVLWGLCQSHIQQGRLPAAHALAEQLMDLAQRVQDPALLLEAHETLGEALFWTGEVPLALEHCDQGVVLHHPQQHRDLAFLYGVDSGVLCRGFAAWALSLLGYPTQALQRLRDMLTLAQELAYPYSLATALLMAAWVHMVRRDGPAAQERAEALMALATAQGFSEWLAFGSIQRGWALTAQGQGEAGIAQMRQGLAAVLAAGTEIMRPYLLVLLAEAHGKSGQAQEGLATLAEARATVDKTGERWTETELYRMQGEILGQERTKLQLLEAEACFHQALEIARRQQAKSLELRAAISLARLWQRQGKRAEARQLLAPIYGWFTEGFDTADLQDAKVLLEALT